MARYETIPTAVRWWGKSLLGPAHEAHTVLGPGFAERIYFNVLHL